MADAEDLRSGLATADGGSVTRAELTGIVHGNAGPHVRVRMADGRQVVLIVGGDADLADIIRRLCQDEAVAGAETVCADDLLASDRRIPILGDRPPLRTVSVRDFEDYADIVPLALDMPDRPGWHSPYGPPSRGRRR